MSNLNGKAAHNHVRGNSFSHFDLVAENEAAAAEVEAHIASEAAEFDARKFEAETDRVREQSRRVEIEGQHALEMYEAETRRFREQAEAAEAAAQRELERMRLEIEKAKAPAEAEAQGAAIVAAIGAVERVALAAIEAGKAAALAATEAEVKIAATPESYKLRLEAKAKEAEVAQQAIAALIGGLGALGAFLAEKKMAVPKKAAIKIPARKAAKKAVKTPRKKPVKKSPAAD